MCIRDIQKEAIEAEERIRPLIRETPLERSFVLGQMSGADVYLKLENFQITGSFKLRGAMNKILSLTPAQLKKGVVTASSGNHAAAFAHLVDRFGLKGTIFLPETVAGAKTAALDYHSAELKFIGNDCIIAETAAKKMAIQKEMEYISPYNDLKIIGGQATVGIELRKQASRINAVFIPVGGGGLAAGIGGYLKSQDDSISVIGCQPENSPVMYESIKAGHIVEMESAPSLADGTAGGIDKDAITLELCRCTVDDFVLVSEKEIRDAIIFVLDKHYLLIEGAAALTVAAFLKSKEQFSGQTVVLIISGAKIGLDKLIPILCEQEDA
jgi:threonine dehydratase